MKKLGDFLKEPKYQELIKEAKEKREGYDPAKWEEVKRKFLTKAFPEAMVEKLVLEGRVGNINKGESHVSGNATHSLHTYTVSGKTEGFEIDWSYSFCATCNKIINKKATLLNNYENLAAITWFVRNGEEVEARNKSFETRPAKIENIDQLVDSLNLPLTSGLKVGDNK
jgi:hypothetical protein